MNSFARGCPHPVRTFRILSYGKYQPLDILVAGLGKKHFTAILKRFRGKVCFLTGERMAKPSVLSKVDMPLPYRSSLGSCRWRTKHSDPGVARSPPQVGRNQRKLNKLYHHS